MLMPTVTEISRATTVQLTTREAHLRQRALVAQSLMRPDKGDRR